MIKLLGTLIGVPVGIFIWIGIIGLCFSFIFWLEDVIKGVTAKIMMFPNYDMFEDDLEGLPFAHRDMSGDDDRTKRTAGDISSLSTRHLFVHGSKGGKKINGKDVDAQPLLLPESNKEEIIVPDPTTGKPREPTEVEVVDIEVEEKVEEPKEILVDLNK